MDELKQNYYGSLCTEMYEILHGQAPQDELQFYLSYVEKGHEDFRAAMWKRAISCAFLARGFKDWLIRLC